MFASLSDLQRLFVFGTLLATLEFTTCVKQFYRTVIFTFYLQKGLQLQWKIRIPEQPAFPIYQNTEKISEPKRTVPG